MKVVIQIPAYNEEQTLGKTLAALPRTLPGVRRVEWLVVDDGSTDRTLEVARAAGVDHLVRLPRNTGLAHAFMRGLEASLAAGADAIVNTDADNQYCAADISALLEPILRGEADIVVGARPIEAIRHFSPLKKFLQRLGSWVVRWVSGTDIQDAPSGFRAIRRRAAQRLHIFGKYTYTLEMIIQAGQKRMPVVSVPVRVNGYERPSRLMRGTASYVFESVLTLLRMFVMYRPFRFFAAAGMLPVLAGAALALATWNPPQPLALLGAGVLIIFGIQLWIFGVIADLLAANRLLLEDIRLRVRQDPVAREVAEAAEDAAARAFRE
jgi:glycosyltransferase involved in cell wall biosynthesis